MGINDVYNKIQNRIDTKLINVSRTDDFPKPIRDFLEVGYSSKDLSARLSATLFNGVFTENKNKFLMSRDLMRMLLERDNEIGNTKRRTINDKEYNKFVASLVLNEVVEILSPQRGKNAATWGLLDETVVYYFDNKNFFKKLAQDIELDNEGYPTDMIEQYQNATDTDFEDGLYQEQEKQLSEKAESKQTIKNITPKSEKPNNATPKKRKDWTFD